MRTAVGNIVCRLQLAIMAASLAALADSPLEAADSAPSRPPALFTSEPAAPALLGRAMWNAPAERRVPSRRHAPHGSVIQASGASDRGTDNAPPPVPMEPDTPIAPAPVPEPPVLAAPPSPPPVPFLSPFGNRAAFHDRLRARRLARVQQMRQSAEQAGDAAGAQRAQYLEGMVNQLHDQGLFSFAQQVIGAIQNGQLNAAAAGASAGAAELPDADLGSPAPLPDADLGSPAPLPEDDASAKPESTPELPPGTAPADGGDTAPKQP